MTRKHFNAIAATLAKHNDGSDDYLSLINSFAQMCANENINFNYDRFINACENGL